MRPARQNINLHADLEPAFLEEVFRVVVIIGFRRLRVLVTCGNRSTDLLKQRCELHAEAAHVLRALVDLPVFPEGPVRLDGVAEAAFLVYVWQFAAVVDMC